MLQIILKVNRIIYSYAVKITDEPYQLLSGNEILKQTARITFRDVNKNIIERKKFGVTDIEWLYEQINKGKSIDISQQYIKNFSSKK